MRKLFTRLISIFILIMVFVLQGFTQTFPDLGPSSEFANHKKTDVFVLTASEKVVPGTGVIRLKTPDPGGVTLGAYQATNSKVSIEVKTDGSSVISVDFTSYLAEETAYIIEVDANFVKADDNGQANAFGDWDVLVGDFTAPMLATTNPLLPKNGETTAVQLNADLTIKFNEPVQIAAGGMLYIYTDNGTDHGDLYDVIEASDVSGAMTSTLVINTNIDFKQSTKYYVTIPNGAIVDYNGGTIGGIAVTDNKNPFAGWLATNSWAFTTRDATAPTVADIMADNIGATKFDVFIKLNKKGKAYLLAVENGQTPVAGDFVAGNGMKTVTITDPAVSVKAGDFTQFYNVAGTAVAPIVEGGDYDIWVITENAETVAPTVSAPMKKLDVKTVDVTVPTVLSMNPVSGDLASDINTKNYLTIELSEKVKLGTGSVDVYTWDASLNHTLLINVPVASCMVSIKSDVTENDSLYIPVVKTAWLSQASYFVKYNEGIVTDLAGNKLAGISTTEDWKFTVQDYLAPTYTSVPVNGATGVKPDAPQIVLTFNETLYSDATGTPMVIGDIAPPVIDLKKGTAAVSYLVSSFDGKVIKLDINPAELGSLAAFELSVDTKKFFDLSGNVGKTVDVINFTLKDYVGPVVTIEPVMAGASDNILIKFDEPVLNADGTAVTDADVEGMVIFRKGTNASGAIVSATYSVAADAKSFIINPTNDFTTPGDKYYVRLGAGAVKDASGNANLLAYQEITVKDFIAPTAAFSGIGTSPVDPGSVAAVITFSEAMETLDGNPVTGDASSLVNFKEGGENAPFTAAWDLAVPETPKIVITATYNPSKTYTISVGKSLQDESGNMFMGISTTFTTMSNVAPALSSVSPKDGAVEQANNVPLVVTFDQPVIAGAGSITLTGTSATVGAVSISGAVVTIAHTSFVNDETITVNVPAGFVKGVNNIDAPVVSWTFKTHETVKPLITVYSPAVGGTGVDLDTELSLTYSEKIVLKTGNIYIKDYATDVTIQSLTAANCAVKASPNDNQLVITPVADLDYNKQYYVVITEGLVEDVNGNKAVAITNNLWNFTTAATPGAFKVASSVPADEADKVAAGTNPITVVFNRDIKVGSSSASALITLTNVTDGLVVVEDAANTGRFTYNGSTLTINTATDVVANKEYLLTLEAGIVKDNYDTPSDYAEITFYTMDVNGPKVVSTTPAKDATNVPKTTTVVVTWDETPLMASDGSAISAAKIKSNALVTVNGTTNYTASVNGLVWTLTMDAAFAENILIPVVVKQTMVKDAGGNTQSADYSWSFTTEDRTCNKPTAFVVTENTKGDQIKFTVNFDEKGKVYYKLQPSADAAPGAGDIIASGKMIEFAAAGTSAAQTVTGLVSGAKYKAYFVAVDASANANQSTIYAPAEITTIDVVPPVVTAMVPVNGAMDVTANTTLKLSFNETVVIGAGNIVIREVATDIIVEVLTVTAGNTAIVTTDGKSVATITRVVALSSKTSYYVEVAGGTFEDLSANPMAAISGVDAWAFKTKDTVAPLLVKTAPNYAAVTTPLITKDSTLLIMFNEAMKVPTGVLYVRYAAAPNAVFEVVNGADLTMSEDMKTISFMMSNVPVEQVEFYVDMTDLVLKDLADNAWVNTIGSSWNFIIKDQTPPALATIVPAGNATGIDVTTDVVITFTEGVFKSPDATVFTATTIKDVISLKDAAGTAVKYTATLTTVDTNSGVVTVTLNPDADLMSETVYTVTISPVVDILKNVSSEIASSFTTKDVTPPYVSMWNPDMLTEFNPKTGVVTATFNEPVYDDVLYTSEGNKVLVPVLPENIPDFFTYNIGTLVRDTNGKIVTWTPGTAVGFTGTISEDNMVMTLTPKADEVPLTSEAWYGVFLKPGVVEDAAENDNLVDTTIFRVEDTVKPLATAYTPVGATAKDGAMTITFDEKVMVGMGNILIRNYDNGEIIETISVADSASIDETTGMIASIKHADFPAAMDFYVTAEAGTFTDASTNMNPWDGIANDKINTWTFSTADAVPPTIISNGLYPAPGSTNTALNTAVELTFDKEIALNTTGTQWIIIYNEDWTPYQTIEVNSANVDLKPISDPVYLANRVLSVKHANLEPNKMYYIRVMPGSVIDVAGNAFAGIMDDTWSFSTEDNSAPNWVTLKPADNASAVDHKTTLEITFDRSIMSNAAGMIKLYKEQPGSLGILIETIDPTSPSVMIDEKVATIMLTDWLEYENSYYVIVEKGAFTNTSVSKLPFKGITTTQEWNFSVKKQVCDTMDIIVTVMDEMECSAMVNIDVVSDVETVLTLNGDTIMTGDTTLAAGMYTAMVYNVDGDCSEMYEFTIGSMPVMRYDTVYTIISGQVHYMDVESGIDTMLTIGDHTFMYDYMGCERTLEVAVIKIVGTPTIKEIQGEGDESPLEGETVFCVGTVSAVAPGEGFFMQDDNAAWSGIWVEFSDATTEGLQIGNGVIVRGKVAEVANVTSLTEITMSFIPPSLLNVEPVMVSPSEVGTEMYESVLVKVKGAKSTAVNASGEWTIYYEESDNAVVNDWLYSATVVEDKYYDVTGVVNGRLDFFRIEPRMVLDVKNLDITPVIDIEVDGFNVYPNPFNDKITIDNYDKLTRVVVSNIAGQRVIDVEYPTREIRTANLVSGIYVISLYTENGVAKTERMIKR